ncbi:prepilin peptidase (plasmid) [Streptomyces sp. Q6]|uniref:Prepilin peptidase n=1 Tax=Streptomyces citrinus TaxID=3118173 RepID=A0ACD5AQT8_9ACTN
MLAVIVAAAAWGAVTGWCAQAALYRLSVPVGDPWQSTCPAGHRLPSGARTWLLPVCPAGGHHYGDRRSVGVVCAAAAAICGVLASATGARPELVAWLLLAPPALVLGLIDARVHRLLDRLTLPLAAAVLLLLAAASLLPDSAGSLPTAALGCVVLGAVFSVMFFISPRAMGFGDVKLGLFIGATLGWYGWSTLLYGVLVGHILAAGYGIVLIARGKATAKTPIALGPPLLLGALLALAAGAAAVH